MVVYTSTENELRMVHPAADWARGREGKKHLTVMVILSVTVEPGAKVSASAMRLTSRSGPR